MKEHKREHGKEKQNRSDRGTNTIRNHGLHGWERIKGFCERKPWEYDFLTTDYTDKRDGSIN
jgi:hypothetical protein